MAVERIKEFTLNLGEMLNTRLESFYRIRKGIQAKEEAAFQRKVMDEDLSFEQQVAYYQQQLKKEQNRIYPFAEYIDEIKTEISNLKRLARYEKLNQDYLENYTQYKEGRLKYDSLMKFLKDKIASGLSPEIRTQFEEHLSKLRIEKIEAERSVLENRITLAKKDKSIELIDKILGEIDTKRGEAVVSGDEEYVTALDVKIQALQSRKQALVITGKIHDFEMRVLREGLTSNKKLNLLNNTIGTADRKTMVTIDGVQWDSEQAYWTAQRDAYIAGMGSGEFTDFLDDFSTEVKERLGKLALMNEWGFIPFSTIKAIDKDYRTLAAKPEFARLTDKIESYRMASVSEAVDKSAKAIMAEAEAFGEYDRGEQALKNLQAKTGIDMTSYLGDLYYTKITTIPSKSEALKKTAEILAEQRGTTPEEEYEKLIKSPFEPEPKVLEKSIEVPAMEEQVESLQKQIAETQQKIAEAKKKGKVAPAKEPPAPEKPAVAPTTYKIKSGDTLLAIARRYGTTVSALMKANPQVKDPNKIYAGRSLSIPTAVKAPAPKAEPKPTPKPEPTPKAPTPKTHIVKSGETLWGIAQKYLGSGARWRELGYTGDPRKLRVGQKLTIPQ